MKVIVKKFYDEPVIALAVIQAVLVTVAAVTDLNEVVTGIAAAGLVGLEVLKRALVTPEYITSEE